MKNSSNKSTTLWQMPCFLLAPRTSPAWSLIFLKIDFCTVYLKSSKISFLNSNSLKRCLWVSALTMQSESFISYLGPVQCPFEVQKMPLGVSFYHAKRELHILSGSRAVTFWSSKDASGCQLLPCKARASYLLWVPSSDLLKLPIRVGFDSILIDHFLLEHFRSPKSCFTNSGVPIILIIVGRV